MLDISHLAGNSKYDIQVFNASSTGPGGTWQTWRKPRGINFVQFFALAGGGGGGGTVSGAVVAAPATTGYGAAGGGSSAQSILTFAAWALPDVLYVSVGFGGAGGTAGSPVTNAGNGVNTYISLAPNTTTNNLLMVVGGGMGGVYGSPVIGVASGGFGGGATSMYSAPLSSLAISAFTYNTASQATTFIGNISIPGQGGGYGGSNPAAPARPGASLALPINGLMVTGGAGGGANAFSLGPGSVGAAGGSITGAGIFPTLSGGTAGALSNASGGGTGSANPRPVNGLFYFYGGSGGGGSGGQAPAGSASNTGGPGGDGGYGCGGGGGGAGITPAAGSNGGRGGDGIIVATAW